MEVTYELSKNDISQLFRYIRNRRSQIRPVYWHAIYLVSGGLLVGTILLQVIVPHSQPANDLFSSAFLLVAIFFYLLYIGIIRPRIAECKAIQNPRVMSHRTILISNLGVYIKHSLGESILYWPSIVDIIDDKDCFYLFLENNNALTVPKRAFSNHIEAQEFYDIAWQNWQSAKNLAPPNQAIDPATWPPPPQVGKP